MRLLRLRLTVRWLLLMVAISAGFTWAVMMGQRVFHYEAQAEIQARLEATHRREAQRLRTVDKGGLGAQEAMEMETEQADHHGHLKAQYRRLASRPWENAPADLPLPYPWNRDRDRDVLETALADLFDPKNPENAIDFRTPDGRPCPELVLAETTYRWSSNPALDEADDACNDLRRRNSGGPVLIAQLGLGRTRKIRYDDPERLYEASVNAELGLREYFQKNYPRACGYAWVALPGYSRDGRKAVVFFKGGFSGHATAWTYRLERTDRGWEVRHRDYHLGE